MPNPTSPAVSKAPKIRYSISSCGALIGYTETHDACTWYEGNKEKVTKPNRQKEQEKLVEQAMQQPGVAAAIEVFTVASQYAPLPVVQPPAGASYATGGNQR